MEHGLPAKLVQEFREAFDFIDKDQDGIITMSELMKLLSTIDHKTKEVAFQASADHFSGLSQGQESITFQNFLGMMAFKMREAESVVDIGQVFRAIDKDQNGFISMVELKHIMMKLGEKLSDEEVEEMMELASTNEEGEINYEEFVNMLMKT